MDKDTNLKKAFDALKERAKQYEDAIDNCMVCHGADELYGYRENRLLPAVVPQSYELSIKMPSGSTEANATTMVQYEMLKAKGVKYDQPQISFVSKYGSLSSIMENVYVPAKIAVMLGLDTTGEIEALLNELEVDGIGSVNSILNKMIDQLIY